MLTPTHSPRLKPYSYGDGYKLSDIHNFSAQHTPALAPMEPGNLDGRRHPNPVTASKDGFGLDFSDIVSKADGAQRKLPLPRLSKALFSISEGWEL